MSYQSEAVNSIFLFSLNISELSNALDSTVTDCPAPALCPVVRRFIAELAARNIMIKATVVTQKEMARNG